MFIPTVVFADTNCVVVDNDKLEIGTEVACGDEHFYVLSSDDNEVRMITKYNLNVGKSYVRKDKDLNEDTGEYYCKNTFGSNYYSTYTSDGPYYDTNYCTYYINVSDYPITQNKDLSFDYWDDNGNLSFPQKALYFMTMHYSYSNYTEGDVTDTSYTYSDTRFKNFKNPNYNYFNNYKYLEIIKNIFNLKTLE